MARIPYITDTKTSTYLVVIDFLSIGSNVVVPDCFVGAISVPNQWPDCSKGR